MSEHEILIHFIYDMHPIHYVYNINVIFIGHDSKICSI